MERFRVASGDAFRLRECDPADTKGETEAGSCRILDENRERIADLQNVLYAEKRRALLILLQSMDTGGKDPIIRDVLDKANSQACRVTAFKKASETEARHDRFWRFHTHVPMKGEIGVFNRSYYDEIVAQDAHGELNAEALEAHYRQMRNFEEILAANDIKIVKMFLHISKEEQKRRLQERIDDPDRHWELSESDFRERRYWDGYMRAFEEAIRQTNTEWAPWYVIGADAKWCRDAAASIVIAEALERMNPKFPPAKIDLSAVELD
jgi:PPK2 family polyphosphate:nucleotide phosphotransferase